MKSYTVEARRMIIAFSPHLEDHPRTRKWLITVVSKSPKQGWSPSKWPKWLIHGSDPNHLLTGMLLQAKIYYQSFPEEKGLNYRA